MILYRPVGPQELALIAASGYTTFPPRLPEQPIFYPVLNQEYAAQIAQAWNAASPPYAGFVTCFELEPGYAATFAVHTVGGKIHQELWVPSEELPEFNRHLVGKIVVIDAFYGAGYQGSRLEIPDTCQDSSTQGVDGAPR